VRLIRLFLSIFIVCFAGFAVADDGWWSESGGIGFYGKSHPNIRMVSEDLRIRIVDDQVADVNVLFTFRNEGKATGVTMAFPENYELRVGNSLEDFRTWVDGKRVSVHRKVVSMGDPTNEDKMDRIGKAVWLKQVKFASNQTRHVRVSYEGNMSGNTSGDLSFSYTLTTGATWKGPIGVCNITVNWPKFKKQSAPYLHLAPANWHYLPGRKATAKLVNWKPKEDLWMEMLSGFGNFWINGQPLSGQENKDALKVIAGDERDPLIQCKSLEGFFAGDGGKHGDWGAKPRRWFGGGITVSKGVLTLASGAQVKLRRGYKFIGSRPGGADQDYDEFVYLSDLVMALGGKFKFNTPLDRVELIFP
jgi:hypothetical protein